jgi:hypothetical protein
MFCRNVPSVTGIQWGKPMAKRSFSVATWTPTAVADTTSMTASGFMGLQGGSTTQRILVSEVFMGGQAGASSPTFMVLARDSTVAVTPTALTTGQKDASLDPATAALAAPPVPFVAASTEPQRSSTLGLLNLSFNAFGGIVRWVAYPGEELILLGNTASFGEISLSAYTGGTPGLMGSHIVYEPL